MIQNLNKLSFQRYGTVAPERGRGRVDLGEMLSSQVMDLSPDRAPVYCSDKPMWLCNKTGMTALAVSRDGEPHEYFYLDKTVCINPGVHFSLHPVVDQSQAQLAGDEKPQVAGWIRSVEDFHIRRNVDVISIFTFFYHEKEKGFVFPGERHRALELTYVDKGAIHSVCDGMDLVLNQGELVIYGPDQWHMQYADMDVSASYITITFEMSGPYLERLINRKMAIPQKALPLLQGMLRETEQLDEYSDDMLISMLQVLMLDLLREQNRPEPAKLRTANAVNAENEVIRRAQQYIGANVRKKLNVPLVARYVDVSPSYLTALFRKNLQISPGEYIRRVKLQESKQMIREGDMNFTEIAAALQYSTVHHFSRQFKDKFGITPTEYAKSVR